MSKTDTDKTATDIEREKLNLDPITNAPGSHPVGTGVGSASAAAAGAAIGAVVGGPVGLAVGGVIGAVAGGAAGHGVGEKVNPTAEDVYWRANYATRPYVKKEREYVFYQPAYRYGWEAREEHAGQTWDDVEKDLNAGWTERKGTDGLLWDDAKPAVHDAWNRVGAE
ncbi:MAG: hypothetical protein ACYC3F_13755 [Gemmatimonadaceae bacterium]